VKENQNFFNRLKKILYNFTQDELVLFGIGNIFRHDDGFGIFVVEELKKKNIPDVLLYSASDTSIDEVILDFCEGDRKMLIFIDAGEILAPAGCLNLLTPSEIDNVNFKFHGVPLGLYTKLIENSGKFSWILACQPLLLSFTSDLHLSECVEKSAYKVIDFLYKLIKEKNDNCR